VTDDGELIPFRNDLALIRASERFLAALAAGEATEFEDQYMRMAPQFESAAGRYTWLGESLFLGPADSPARKRSHTSSTACSERVAVRRSTTPTGTRPCPHGSRPFEPVVARKRLAQVRR
jgi:Protein of unknown function (DUF3237)